MPHHSGKSATTCSSKPDGDSESDSRNRSHQREAGERRLNAPNTCEHAFDGVRYGDDVSNAPFVESTGDFRVKRPSQADERTTILAFLQWHRETLGLKWQGLTPAQLAEQAVGRSALSLLGLLRHAAESERFWFRQVMTGAEVSPLFSSASAPGSAFDVANADAAMVTETWDAWRAEVAFADRFVATAPDLDATGDEPGEGPVSLRWVLMHMVEEYARHNGHADLLREQIDGVVGL